ncbi:MAG: two-component system response regulator AtoC [Parvicellaceae bacterium]
MMSDGKEIREEDISFPTVKGDELYTSMEKTLREYEADIVTFFLKKYGNNVVAVAEKLDIGKSTIYNMKKSGEIKI